jgi:glycosyltransferase involved in cell wall biosynthesis
MNHDVINDRYGRLYQLPNELSRLGHDVHGFCFSYQNLEATSLTHRSRSVSSGTLCWHSLPAGLLGWKIPSYLFKASNLIEAVQPDVIIGGSDAPHTIFTRWLAHKAKIPYFLDLYDNFESFGLTKIPGIADGYRKSLKEAKGITTTSKALQNLIQTQLPGKPTLTIESTISPEKFKHYPKDESRKLFDLPNDGVLIGTAGSLAANRDTKTLYKAFLKIYKKIPNSYLVLAGPTNNNPPPDHPNIIYLGELPHQQVPKLLSSLDVAIICMNDNVFGRYAFPQKAYEILTCRIPVVAANVGALQELFAEYQGCLYQPENTEELQEKILRQLKTGTAPLIPVPSWHEQAKKIEKFIKTNI